MSDGRLAGIARRDQRRAPMQESVSGRISTEAGLEGDFKGRKYPFRQITVLAREDWEEALAELGAADLPWTARRANLLVTGVALPRAKGGLIRVGGTRVVSGILEKRYHASAHGYRVDHALLTGSGNQAAMSSALDAIFTKARHEILSAMASGAIPAEPQDPKRKRMGLWATNARLSPTSVKRVMRLVEKLSAIDTDQDADGAEYGLLVGFYPRAPKEHDR